MAAVSELALTQATGIKLAEEKRSADLALRAAVRRSEVGQLNVKHHRHVQQAVNFVDGFLLHLIARETDRYTDRYIQLTGSPGVMI